LLWPLHQEMRPQSLNDQAAWAHELIGIRGAPLPSDQDRFIAGDRSQADPRPSDQEIVTLEDRNWSGADVGCQIP
jgi:hypothetical protein